MLVSHTMPGWSYPWPPGGTSCLWGQRALKNQPPRPTSQLPGLAVGSQHKMAEGHPGNFLEKATAARITARVDKGDCAGAGWTTLKFRICPRGASMQKQQSLGGLKSSKPWQRGADISVSVMTAWGRRKVFPCTSCMSWRGGVDGCEFSSILYVFWNNTERAVSGKLFLHWKLSSLPCRNEFFYSVLCHIFWFLLGFLPFVTRYLLFVSLRNQHLWTAMHEEEALSLGLSQEARPVGQTVPLLLCQKNLPCFKLEQYHSCCITEPSRKLLFQQLKLYTIFMKKKKH